jgi:hypothetical protein
VGVTMKKYEKTQFYGIFSATAKKAKKGFREL